MSKNKIISLLCPIFFLLFGIWVKVSTLSFTSRDATFPSMIAYATIIVSIIDFIVELRSEDHKDRFKNVNFVALLSCIAAMYLYMFLLKKLGFFIDTALLCAFVMWILGYRRWKVLIISSIFISALVFGAFYGLMNVPMPTLFL